MGEPRRECAVVVVHERTRAVAGSNSGVVPPLAGRSVLGDMTTREKEFIVSDSSVTGSVFLSARLIIERMHAEGAAADEVEAEIVRQVMRRRNGESAEFWKTFPAHLRPNGTPGMGIGPSRFDPEPARPMVRAYLAELEGRREREGG
jgi:hypothetical protein